MGQKQKAHSILESLIHQCAVTAKDHKSTIEIPHNELSLEMGFADQTPMGTCRITIFAEYLDEDEYIYEKESGIAVKNQTPRQ